MALAVLAATTGARAQAGDAEARYAAINKAVPAPPAMVAKGAIEAAQTDCTSAGLTVGPVEPVTAWDRIDASIAAGQLANAWTTTVSRPGCTPAFARYLLLQEPGGGLQAQLLHPGRSYVDLFNLTEGAMDRAMQVAANTADRDIPGCSPEAVARSGRFVSAEVVDSSGMASSWYGLQRAGAWRETWRFNICGRDLTVFVDFVGREDGLKATPAPWASLKR